MTRSLLTEFVFTGGKLANHSVTSYKEKSTELVDMYNAESGGSSLGSTEPLGAVGRKALYVDSPIAIDITDSDGTRIKGFPLSSYFTRRNVFYNHVQVPSIESGLYAAPISSPGTVLSPAVAFRERTTGIYAFSSTDIRFASRGQDILSVNASRANAFKRLLNVNGSDSLPAYSFTSATGSGFGYDSTDKEIFFSLAGARIFSLGNNGFQREASYCAMMFNTSSPTLSNGSHLDIEWDETGASPFFDGGSFHDDVTNPEQLLLNSHPPGRYFISAVVNVSCTTNLPTDVILKISSNDGATDYAVCKKEHKATNSNIALYVSLLYDKPSGSNPVFKIRIIQNGAASGVTLGDSYVTIAKLP